MTVQGYIKLWRKVSKNQLWTEEKFTRGQAWIDLIMLANHKEGYIRVRGIKIPVKRGECGWSVVRLSIRWGWSRGKTQRFLNELEKEKQIVQQKNLVTSLFTIVNYNEYQGNGTTNDTTNGQQTDTNKNEKNESNRDINISCDSAESSNDNCPHQKIIQMCNSTLPEWTQPKVWNGNRAAALRARWNAKYTSSSGKVSNTLEFWEDVFKYVRLSKFLLGQVAPTNGHKQFQGSLAWLTKKDIFEKFLEGFYHNR